MTNREIAGTPFGAAAAKNRQDGVERRASFSSQNSQTARDFIESQMRLEADAREVLPYSFDSCTQALGSLRQTLFACLTCNPPPPTPDAPFTPAGVCYSCSIACHGEHTLVELFNKRNFVCDCGTTRMPSSSPCTLRTDPKTGAKGVHSQDPHPDNRYNCNFQNKFCGCGEDYNAQEEKGTMFQCLGLGTVETGGCGEDWWHPECLIGLPRDWYKNSKKNEGADVDPSKEPEMQGGDDEETPLPPAFPPEDDFETFLCYKCVEANPWLKKYAGTPGFLPPVFKEGGLKNTLVDGGVAAPETLATNSGEQPVSNPKKRKVEDDEEISETDMKRAKEEEQEAPSKPKVEVEKPEPKTNKHESLPKVDHGEAFSLFFKEDFREQFCRCPECYPHLAHHIQLREEEDMYEPPLSEDGDGGRSTGTGSLLDRGEAALNNIDRVRAIEGAMVYNHLRDKVKEFLKPFAESGTAVGADDIKAYFEKLRGDEHHIKEAAGKASASSNRDDDGDDGDDDGNQREQSGM